MNTENGNDADLRISQADWIALRSPKVWPTVVPETTGSVKAKLTEMGCGWSSSPRFTVASSVQIRKRLKE